jgi:hypothetical protein
MYLKDAFEEIRTPIRRKVVGRGPGGGLRVFADMRETPFAELGPRDLLDTADICRIYGCSARTVYRWMADHELTPSGRAGRDYLFEKRALISWHKTHRPQPGRNPGG